jgi:hypothetical protein
MDLEACHPLRQPKQRFDNDKNVHLKTCFTQFYLILVACHPGMTKA